jgi:hypothetical protein
MNKQLMLLRPRFAGLSLSNFCHLSIFLLPILALLVSLSSAHGRSLSWDKRGEYRKAGYAELTGAEAARFLIGNSVIVPERKEGATIVSLGRIYYFLDDHRFYQCEMTSSEGDCEFGSWSVNEKGICFDIGACGQPLTVFRSPKWQEWKRRDGQLGVYLTYEHFVSKIVKGNLANGPSFESHVSGHAIELTRSEVAKKAAQFNLPNGELRIYGEYALSQLTGNTFLSKDAEVRLKDSPEDFCPEQGAYYSPDGILVSFACNAQLHSWSIGITRWKAESGKLCRDEADSPQQFGCRAAVVTAVPAQRDFAESEKMHVLNFGGGGLIEDALTAYSGNVFKFKFDGHN